MKRQTDPVASNTNVIEEDSYAAVDATLADIAERLKGANREKRTELAVEVGRAHQRMIAIARRKGGATFAGLMRPLDEYVTGDNVVIFRRKALR